MVKLIASDKTRLTGRRGRPRSVKLGGGGRVLAIPTSRPALVWMGGMSDEAETAAGRLWRDRVQLREHERDEAQARARVAEEKVAILTSENDRLADEIARLGALLTERDAAQARAETEKQMEDLRTALLSQLKRYDRRLRRY
jgi:hypothetical protein